MYGKLIANRYRIEEELGRGSMGLVYRAEDTVEQRPVAVKFLSEQVKARQLESILRFRREATTMSGLSHPHIARVYEVGEEVGRHYIVMEFIKGQELAMFWQKKGILSIDSVLEITRQISTALDYVHSKGIIHRDLKPGNIMVTEDGARPQAKILDFGLARLINLAEITEPEVIVGTFPYMSPEQTGLFDRPIDERSDLYSLGVISYELSTGQLPFKGEDVGSLIHQHLAKVPTRPRDLNPRIPIVVDEIIMKLLQKEMKDRYQTAVGLVYDIDRAVELIEGRMEERGFKLGLGDRVRGLGYRTRLIGRQMESNRLKIAFDKAIDGVGGMEIIGGVAGIGKTRLCNELRAYVREKGGVFISGRSYEYKSALPYNPFRESLDEYIDIISRFSKEKRDICIKSIKEAIGELGQIVVDFSPPIKELLGDVPSIVRLEPERERERFLRTISSLYIGMVGPEMPMVLFLDDLQWTDEGTMELLRYLVGRVRGTNILIIGTYRSEEVGKGHALQRLIDALENEAAPIDRIGLGSLEMKDSEEMVSEILGQDVYGIEKWRRDILGSTEGNPFFIGETIRSLADGGVIRLEEGNWQVSMDRVEAIPISATVTDVILKRMDRLSRDALEVLTLASAIGKQFSFDVLLDIASQDAGQVLDILDEGLNLRLIIESGGIVRKGYNFLHDRVREALYNRIDEFRRKGIHLLIGQMLEKVYGEDIEPVIYDLANHFILSGNKEKIIQYAKSAGDKAKASYANQDARRFYETTLPLLSPQSAHYAKTKESLGDIYMLVGEYQKAIEVYKELLDLTKVKREKARFEGKIGDVYFKEGDMTTSVEHHRKGLEYFGIKLPKTNLGVFGSLLLQAIVQVFHTLFPTLFIGGRKVPPDSSDWEALRISRLLSYSYWFVDLNRCLDVHLRGMNKAELMGESRELAAIYSNHGIVMVAIPLLKRAVKYQIRGLVIRERLGDRWGIAQSNSFLGLSTFSMSQWDRSIGYLKEGIEGLTRLGDPFENYLAYQHLGYNYYMKGQFQRSVEYLGDALDIATRVGDPRSMGQSLSPLGVNLYLQGNKKKGVENVEKSVEHSRSSYDNLVLAMNLRDAGYLYLRDGDYNKALERFQESMGLIKKFHFRCTYIVETYIGLARAYLGDIEGFRRLSKREKKIRGKKVKKFLSGSIGPFGLARFFRNYLGYAYRTAGQYYWACGKKRKAIGYMQKSIRVCKELGAQYELGLSYYELGRMELHGAS